MRFLNRIIYLLIQSNLIIGFSGGFLTYGIARHFSIRHDFLYALIVFLLIISVYTLQRIVDETGFSVSERYVWGKNKSFPFAVSILSLILAAGTGIIIFNRNLYLLFSTLFFSFLCYWYTVPFFGKKLREIPGVKIIVTAVTWAYACAFFPLMNEGIPFEQTVVFSLLLLLYLAAIILAFDIRDVHTDDLSQSTIPQIIGIIPTKILGGLLLISFSAGNTICGFVSVDNRMFHSAVVMQLIFLIFTSEKRNFLYFGAIDVLIVLLGYSYLL